MGFGVGVGLGVGLGVGAGVGFGVGTGVGFGEGAAVGVGLGVGSAALFDMLAPLQELSMTALSRAARSFFFMGASLVFFRIYFRYIFFTFI